MTDRFGDFVLYKPPLQGSHQIALWLGPRCCCLRRSCSPAGLRQSGARTGSSELSDAERARARALLGDTANSSASGCQRNPATYPVMNPAIVLVAAILFITIMVLWLLLRPLLARRDVPSQAVIRRMTLTW